MHKYDMHKFSFKNFVEDRDVSPEQGSVIVPAQTAGRGNQQSMQPTTEFKPQNVQTCQALVKAPSNCFALAAKDPSVDLGAHLHTVLKNTLGTLDAEDKSAVVRDLWPVFAPLVSNMIMGNSK